MTITVMDEEGTLGGAGEQDYKLTGKITGEKIEIKQEFTEGGFVTTFNGDIKGDQIIGEYVSNKADTHAAAGIFELSKTA